MSNDKQRISTDEAQTSLEALNLARSAAIKTLGGVGVAKNLIVDGNVGIGTTSPDSRLDIEDGAFSLLEMTSPGAPAANKVVMFAEDDGAGKTRLMARFNTGATQQLAIQP